MTSLEKNILKNEIVNEILYNSKLIEQLEPAVSLSEDDKFEINGGRYVSFSMIKAAIDFDSDRFKWWLEDLGYATQVWVREYVASHAPSVDLSAYLAKTEAAALYQPKGSYAAASHSHDAYISAIGTSGDRLTYTRGDTTTSLTVPFASRSGEVYVADAHANIDTSQAWQAYRTDLKARFFDVYDNGGPDSYGCVLEIAGRARHWQPQLWFGGWVNGVLRHRNRDYNSGTWGPWHTLLDTANYADTLDTRYMRRDTFDELFEKVTVDGSVFIKAKLPFFSTGDVAAFGPGADIPGGSGGAAYDRLDAWGDYSAAKAGWVLSAALGHDLHTRLQNVYGKPAIDSMLAGFVTLATRQEISGEKIFTNSVYVTNGRISGEISSAYTNHGIRLGIASRDYCDFLEYGGVWNFYKSRSGTETLVAKISEAGMAAKAFIKDGGTASQVLMADGSVASKVTMTAVSHLGWTSNAAAALLIPTMSALALWNGRYNATGSNLQYCDRGRFGDIVTHGHGEYVTALGISGDNITWTRNGATNSIVVPYAARGGRLQMTDSRSVNTNYTQLGDKGVYADFKSNIIIGLPTDSYSPVLSVKPWVDSSGGHAHQLAFHGAGEVYYRLVRHDDTFGAWQKILTDANYASMLDGRYVNKAGDKMAGDLAVRKLHLQGGNEFNCDDKLWIAYRSTPQGVNVCHADQPFTYGSAGHEVLHRGNYTNLVDTLAQPLTIRCGNDAKLIFDNTDGERYTRLSFREAGAEYASITAHSDAFVFSGKPVSAPYFEAATTTLCPNLNADLLDGLHLSRTPAANAVPAYDADTMLPVSAGLNMRNDQMAELTEPGWYRVFSSHSSDASRASLLLFLGRNYSYTSNENYVFSISLGCGVGDSGYRPAVTQLSGRAVGRLIPKIRVLQKWNSVYHVDIYYSGSVANSVFSFGIGPGRFAAPVAAAIPGGYTSYEFGTIPNGFRCDGIAETTDLRLSRYLFFKHSGANNGIYLSPNPDGSLNISAHSGYSYAKSLGSIGYDGCFRITSRTAIGPSGFGVGLQLRDSNHTGIEVCGGNTTMGMGCHRDGRWYWWRGTTNPDASSDKAYVMNFDGTVFNFGDRDIAVRRVYLDSACTVWFQYNAAKGVIEASHTIVSRKDVAAFSA